VPVLSRATLQRVPSRGVLSRVCFPEASAPEVACAPERALPEGLGMEIWHDTNLTFIILVYIIISSSVVTYQRIICMARKRHKVRGKYVSPKAISHIKRLLDGYRLPYGYELKKRKRHRRKSSVLGL